MPLSELPQGHAKLIKNASLGCAAAQVPLLHVMARLACPWSGAALRTCFTLGGAPIVWGWTNLSGAVPQPTLLQRPRLRHTLRQVCSQILVLSADIHLCLQASFLQASKMVQSSSIVALLFILNVVAWIIMLGGISAWQYQCNTRDATLNEDQLCENADAQLTW